MPPEDKDLDNFQGPDLLHGPDWAKGPAIYEDKQKLPAFYHPSGLMYWSSHGLTICVPDGTPYALISKRIVEWQVAHPDQAEAASHLWEAVQKTKPQIHPWSPTTPYENLEQYSILGKSWKSMSEDIGKKDEALSHLLKMTKVKTFMTMIHKFFDYDLNQKAWVLKAPGISSELMAKILQGLKDDQLYASPAWPHDVKPLEKGKDDLAKEVASSILNHPKGSRLNWALPMTQGALQRIIDGQITIAQLAELLSIEQVRVKYYVRLRCKATGQKPPWKTRKKKFVYEGLDMHGPGGEMWKAKKAKDIKGDFTAEELELEKDMYGGLPIIESVSLKQYVDESLAFFKHYIEEEEEDANKKD